MKYMLILAVAMCAACKPSKPKEVWATDQEKRQELFFLCLDKAGLHGAHTFSAAKNAGAGDVVRECGNQALYMAKQCIENCPAFPEKSE